MSTGSTTLLKQAQTALKSGRRQQARQLLQQAIRQYPQDYRAWLWLASVTTSPRASLDYVLRAQALKPGDPAVQKARVWAEKRLHTTTTRPTVQQPNGPTARPTWPRAAVWGSITVMIALILLLAGLLLWLGFNPAIAAGPLRSIASLAGWDQPEPDSSPAGAQEVAAGPSPIAEQELRATPVPAGVNASALTGERLLAPPRLEAKDVAAISDNQVSQPRPTWTVTPLPTSTPVPTPTFVPTFASAQGSETASRPFGVGPTERWIDVDLTSQRLTAFEGDQAVLSTLISSGTWNHPTVTGQFRIWLRFESQTMDGRLLGYDYYLENVPYVMYFYEDYALHGTYWHNNFGTPMSHGCVNLATADAAWLFDWSTIGTLVNVHH